MEYELQPSPKKYIKQTESMALRGVWTPVFTFVTPGNLSVVYSTQLGNYIRILSLVHAQFSVDMSTFTHTTALNDARITGLPFPALAQDNAAMRAFGNCFWTGVTAAGYSQLSPFVLPGNSYIQFALSGSGLGSVFLSATHMPTGGTPALVGSIIYVAED